MKLAEIFVAVRPDTAKTGPELKKKLEKIDPTAEGKKAGNRFGIGFSKTLPGIGGRVTSFFKTNLGTAAALASGAAIGGGLISGFGEALDQGAIKAKFQAQLGLSTADSAKAGKAAGDLYKANYGDSLAGVNDAIKSVVQNTNVSLNSVDLKPVTAKVLDLASTFDQDLGGVTRATGQLMRTGLAKNATEALDIITKGFQSGADKSEDFLDTLNEYGTQFRKLGIDGATATGLISQGLKAGARDGDLVADSIKEFSIRAVDGSATTSAGFKAIGLDAQKMAEQIAKGGKPAAEGLDQVLDRLRKIKDPVKQSQAAVQLFGTQAEDMGKALYALDPSNAVATIGAVGGAADKMDKTLGDTPKAKITSFFRTIKQGAIDSLGGVITAFASGETKSQGFQGIIEKVAVGARNAFDFFRSDILPHLRDFAGFLNDKAVPAISSLVTNLATDLKPVLSDVFGYFRDNVLPPLKDFAGFIGDKIAPKLGEMATALSKNKDFIVPFTGVILAVVAGLKAWAIIQAILNIELLANPIGLVVVAIAALVGGIVWAFKNVGWFHDALVGAFHGIQAAAQIFAPLVKAAVGVVIAVFSLWWNYYAKPILGLFWAALKKGWEAAQTFGRIFTAAFNAIKEPARVAIKFVVDTFLNMVGTVLDGAAKAFGWVPDLGGKLKTAAKAFATFRDQVNSKLDGLKDHQVDFTIKYTSTGVNLSAPSSVGRRASGGPAVARGNGKIQGHGSPTSDNIDLRVSPTEWVIKGKSSAKYGDYAMGSVNDGTALIIPDAGKRAGGGKAGVYAANHFPAPRAVAGSVSDAFQAIAKPVAQQIAKYGGNLMSTRLWGESQAGKPYGWGMGGPDSYDCSGFVGALINHALGKPLYSRIGATGSMPWPMFAPGPGRFSVGWFQGNPGHTAATIDGENFESAGGVGTRYGSRARGATNGLFSNLAHVKGFRDGGLVGEGRRGDGPFDLINPKGQRFLGKDMLEQIGVKVYDQGGTWPSGTLGANLSGKSETVVPGGGDVELGKETLRALSKAFADSIASGKFVLVQRGGSYILQNSNG